VAVQRRLLDRYRQRPFPFLSPAEVQPLHSESDISGPRVNVGLQLRHQKLLLLDDDRIRGFPVSTSVPINWQIT
jgi:hypothetical protein